MISLPAAGRPAGRPSSAGRSTETHGLRIAIIENEFGADRIDGTCEHEDPELVAGP
ncbi:hypothetical protein ACWDY4_09855 [Streptomyces olivaceoviridis]